MKLQDLTETTKPATWNDVTDTISPGNVDETKLMAYSVKDIWGTDDAQPTDKFKHAPKNDTFVVHAKSESYVVSTGGHNYARTVKRID